MNRFEISDDCTTGAEAIARGRAARARLWSAPAYMAPPKPPPTPPAPRKILPPPGPPAASVETVAIPSTFPKIPTIVKAVCDYFYLSINDFLGKGRGGRAPFARQVAVHVALKLTPLSLAQIGRLMERDHTTIIHCRDRIAEMLSEGDEATTEAVNALLHFFATGERRFPTVEPPARPCARRHWKLAHDNELRRMWLLGLTDGVIAKAMGRSPYAIRKRLWHLRLIKKDAA